MPIHIEDIRSDVTVADSELPLSEAQIAKLVELVAARLAQHERTGRQAAQLPRRSIIPTIQTRG